MPFIAIDANIPGRLYSRIASWGFDLIVARQGETDEEFIERAFSHKVCGFLSYDADIPQLLYAHYNVETPCARSPEHLRSQLVRVGALRDLKRIIREQESKRPLKVILRKKDEGK